MSTSSVVTPPSIPLSKGHIPHPLFSGLWIPLVTPFKSDDAVDLAAFKHLVEAYGQTGIAGLVINGTTGEPSALSATEQLQCLDLALETASIAKKHVVAGLSNYGLNTARERLAALNERPLAGVLISAPAGIRPSQAGLLDWFRRIADASAHPLVVYDIPYRTGIVIERDTLLALAEHPNIHAVKDCGGDLGKTLALLRQGCLSVLVGDDLQLYSNVAQGAAGGICASAHLHTDEFIAVLSALQNGEMANAQSRWQGLVPWIEKAFAAPNPAPVKAALAAKGWIQNVLRPPMQAV